MSGIKGKLIYNDSGQLVGATGGMKTAMTNKKRYGNDFYRKVGKVGGHKSRGGGFAYMAKHDPERLAEVGRKGGSKERANRERH